MCGASGGDSGGVASDGCGKCGATGGGGVNNDGECGAACGSVNDETGGERGVAGDDGGDGLKDGWW